MNIYHLLNLFFYSEIALLLSILIAIIFRRIYCKFRDVRIETKRKKIADAIIDLMEAKGKKEVFSFHAKYLLLDVMETFNLRRFQGGDWDEIKEGVSRQYLLPYARKWVGSFSWWRRNFAARTFALVPLKEDEDSIVKLLKDRAFLVRSVAASAAVQIESRAGVDQILEHMSQEEGYGSFYYSDILSQGSRQVFVWIAEIGASGKEAIRLACLKVLGTKTVQVPIPYLEKDLASPHFEIRKAALSIVLRQPQKGSIELFAACLQDKNEEIRKIGASGLANYGEKESLKALEAALLDESWSVRLEAATSLQKLGEIDRIEDLALKKYILEFGAI